jgi:hypothetical protein
LFGDRFNYSPEGYDHFQGFRFFFLKNPARMTLPISPKPKNVARALIYKSTVSSTNMRTMARIDRMIKVSSLPVGLPRFVTPHEKLSEYCEKISKYVNPKRHERFLSCKVDPQEERL